MNSVSKLKLDKTFGKVFREYRLKNKLTQEELSEKVGISLKYISRIENGGNGIKAPKLVTYMDVLGITPNILYKGLMSNKTVNKQIELTEKASSLSEEQLDFLISTIDLLKNLKTDTNKKED